jgi:addiction module RelE/StbE family toxin
MFKKLHAEPQDKFEERLFLFTQDTYHPLLRNHSLGGEWAGCRSINITGDFRAVFEYVASEHCEFVAIGTHSELYS